jgi:hypothetical protein
VIQSAAPSQSIAWRRATGQDRYPIVSSYLTWTSREVTLSGTQLGVQITFEGLSSADANRAATELRRLMLERVDDDLDASIHRADVDSQDAGQVLVLLFGSSAAIAIAEGIRAFLAKRPAQRDGFTIRTADGTEIVATGDAAGKLDAPALIAALNRSHKKR